MYSEIDKNKKIINNFLISHNLESNEISIGIPEIYQDTSNNAAFRYNARIKITVNTSKVDEVKKTSQEILYLLQQGVVITNDYGQGIDFQFTKLNDIKSDNNICQVDFYLKQVI